MVDRTSEIERIASISKPAEKVKVVSGPIVSKMKPEIQRRRSEKTEETRKRILEESIKLFMEQGYEKTTTRELIQKVGILNGSLYNIYKSKESIFTDIILMSLNEIMKRAPKHIDDFDKVELLTYILCIEIYLSKRSKRIAELLCIANENWNVRKNVDTAVIEWAKKNGNGIEFPDLDDAVLRFNACTGGAFIIIEELANNPEAVDEKSAMAITFEMTNALFHKTCDDIPARVEQFIDCVSNEKIEICGLRIL